MLAEQQVEVPGCLPSGSELPLLGTLSKHGFRKVDLMDQSRENWKLETIQPVIDPYKVMGVQADLNLRIKIMDELQRFHKPQASYFSKITALFKKMDYEGFIDMTLTKTGQTGEGLTS